MTEDIYKHPQHPWQSWRDRYIKKLKGRPRPYAVPHNAPPTPPADLQISSEHVSEAPLETNMSKDGGTKFTDYEARSLMAVGADIMRIDPERVAEAWKGWARDNDVRSKTISPCSCLLMAVTFSQRALMMRSSGRIFGRRLYVHDIRKEKQGVGSKRLKRMILSLAMGSLVPPPSRIQMRSKPSMLPLQATGASLSEAPYTTRKLPPLTIPRQSHLYDKLEMKVSLDYPHLKELHATETCTTSQAHRL